MTLGTLSPNDREIVWMRIYEEMNYREIAEILQIKVPAARTRMHAALGRLERALRRSGS